MIIIIDNYDSFTYNLYQYIGEFIKDIRVYRNDKITGEEILELNPEKVIISPGPGIPNNAGNCLSIIKIIAGKIPILGICLGHQCIGQAFGGNITHAKSLFHGKSSLIKHNNRYIFRGIKNPLKVARYHSLAIEKGSLPLCLENIAATSDGEIMAVKHKELNIIGLQFHPESIMTDEGKRLIKNFVDEECCV
ncbi:anthranilate synthase component II [Vallitalea sp.]|uniref:anthranilate synthase component II n=1 Tax=Vallitalea sp. TaxID=1882829 RepID=UPI0025FAE163|nr:aminodeoxychorismate/anthranilate synthase component II [Vallitalea sp.]MCT4687600.1 aminodeoxychorismate/anthranilate synthase component II [Vallitalea sp.]